MKNCALLLTACLIILWPVPGLLLAQTQEMGDGQTFAKQDVKKMRKDEENGLAKQIKALLVKNPTWRAYQAYRKSDSSLCDSCNNPSGCWDNLQSFIVFKSIAQGNCDALPASTTANFIDICVGVKKSTCSSLTGWKKLMCQAFTNGDANLMVKSFSASDFPDYISRKNEQATFNINIYNGFKNSNEGSCDKFTASTNVLQKASCNMLFGNQSYASKIDDLSRDLAAAVMAKRYVNKDYCQKIQDPSVKALCRDDSVMNMDAMLKKVWEN